MAKRFHPNAVTFPGDGTAVILLGGRNPGGLTTKIDADDYAIVSDMRWFASQKGYVVAGARKALGHTRGFRMHRVIVDAPNGMVVDHINGDPLDNRRSNLRLCTEDQSRKNRASAKPGARYKCVRKTKAGRFLARTGTSKNGTMKTIMLGTYDTEEEAARAYDAFAKEAWGEFARLNFPE